MVSNDFEHRSATLWAGNLFEWPQHPPLTLVLKVTDWFRARPSPGYRDGPVKRGMLEPLSKNYQSWENVRENGNRYKHTDGIKVWPSNRLSENQNIGTVDFCNHNLIF